MGACIRIGACHASWGPQCCAVATAAAEVIDPSWHCHDLVAVRRCAEAGQALAFGAARGDIMAHVINNFLLFFCWPAFVTGIVFAAASLLI